MDNQSTEKQSWTFGIMCYNEIGTLEEVVMSLIKTAPHFTSEFEIIIVDDGSTDGSREKAIELEKRYKTVRTIQHSENRGIGATLRSIYLNALKENVANLPADGQFKPEEYLKTPCLPDNSFIAFYRKENTHYNLFRNSLSFVNFFLNRYFIGFVCKDVNWTKIYKSEDIKKLELRLTSSLVETEIGAKLSLLNKEIIEVESIYHERKHGISKGAKASAIFAAAKEIFKLKLEIIRYRGALKRSLKTIRVY